MMDNFGRQKFNLDGQFWASDTQTDGHTDTLLIFIPIDKPIAQVAGQLLSWFVGFVVL